MEKVKRFKIPLFFVLSGIILLPLINGYLKLLEKCFSTSFSIGIILITWLLLDTIVILAINCVKTTKENARRLLKLGKIRIDEVSDCFPDLLDSDVKELEAEIMQLA